MTIDLTQVPLPAAIEDLDYEVLLQAWLDDLVARHPEFSAVLESDPAVKEIQVGAYREMLLRGVVNDGVRAVNLTVASGTDLDGLAANVNVERLLIDPGDPEASPPVPPTLESDGDLRRRALLAFEAITTAGTRDSYRFHTLKADARVRDCSIESPSPSVIDIVILSRDNAGVATQDLLDAVAEAVNDTKIRPLGDRVSVVSATVVPVDVTAELTIGTGPDPAVVLAAATEAVQAYIDDEYPLGRSIPLSGIFAALHQAGVTSVSLTEPAADVAISTTEAASANLLTITQAG